MSHMTTDRPAAVSTPQTAGRQGVTFFTWLCVVQGIYYLATGLWPLVSIETFQMVTGPKTDHLVTNRESDHWLVMTVAVLIVAIAVTLLVTAWRQRRPVEVAVLAIAAILALGGIDVVYVSRGVIWPIYLADAGIEAVLLVAWAFTLVRQRAGDSGAVS